MTGNPEPAYLLTGGLAGLTYSASGKGGGPDTSGSLVSQPLPVTIR
jgi:hypothetical protein